MEELFYACGNCNRVHRGTAAKLVREAAFLCCARKPQVVLRQELRRCVRCKTMGDRCLCGGSGLVRGIVSGD